ncbi:MAG: potassium channel protein [Ilumatobacter sp.]|uniref:potassium channel family protein n=1 Tax=Ilumatobacter sp. TaxID=1967498 RepID=UPI00262E88D8|nr:potassium channel protein [Ilumatobacter sp.]MDJ0768863.1 potassium channel protein [Ilumatobacter sp.]
MSSTIGRLRLGIAMVLTVFVIGTAGFAMFGLNLLDAAYMTIITITTVGYREVGGEDMSDAHILFTMFIIVSGVGTALYTFTLGVQVVVEGQLRDFVGRRRNDRRIAHMRNHVIVCGFGRVGKGVAHDLALTGKDVVIVDQDANLISDIAYPGVVGDATLDTTLRAAGIEKASALVAALEGDAENLFVTLSSKSINPDLFIVARARQEESVAKLANAGADRVVNPQELGAARMASFVSQPNVAEFVDVVMHERSTSFRIQEVDVPERSPVAGQSLREADLRQRAGILVLALRDAEGAFNTNPGPDTVIEPRHVIIAVGTAEALSRLQKVCA